MADEATQDAAQTTEQRQDRAPDGHGKTFTQEDLDRIVEQRLQRTKAQFKDYEDLKQKAQRLDEIEESRSSEAEKLVRAIEKANQAAQDAAERERAATERANNTLIRAAVISEASRQHAIDPDAVYALLDHGKLKIEDGDSVSGVEDAVTSLLSERTYLAGRPANGGGAFDGGARQTAHEGSTRADFNAVLRRSAGFGT